VTSGSSFPRLKTPFLFFWNRPTRLLFSAGEKTPKFPRFPPGKHSLFFSPRRFSPPPFPLVIQVLLPFGKKVAFFRWPFFYLNSPAGGWHCSLAFPSPAQRRETRCFFLFLKARRVPFFPPQPVEIRGLHSTPASFRVRTGVFLPFFLLKKLFPECHQGRNLAYSLFFLFFCLKAGSLRASGFSWRSSPFSYWRRRSAFPPSFPTTSFPLLYSLFGWRGFMRLDLQYGESPFFPPNWLSGFPFYLAGTLSFPLVYADFFIRGLSGCPSPPKH